MAVGGDKKRVLILGAGAAGIGAALELKKASAGAPGLEVTLVFQNICKGTDRCYVESSYGRQEHWCC